MIKKEAQQLYASMGVSDEDILKMLMFDEDYDYEDYSYEDYSYEDGYEDPIFDVPVTFEVLPDRNDD